MLQARSVVKRFGDVEVLNGVDMDLARGQVGCIIGASGSGKSTFLRCVNHLEQIDGGEILIDGIALGYRKNGDVLIELAEKDVCRRRAEVGMVFQSFNLYRHKTAVENIIEAPVMVKKEKKDEAIAHAEALLERVGLGHRKHNYPHQLSGGEQQRVAIARALAMRPKLILFDEPTSALDPELVGEVLEVMKGLAKDGTTMLVVSHEIRFARHAADFVAFMDQGRVVECGPPTQVIDNPEHPRTQAFLSRLD